MATPRRPVVIRPAPATECLHCRQTVEIPTLLAGVDSYAAATRHFGAPCPRCRRPLEFQVQRGRFRLGYTYWSGAMHFEVLLETRVPGLTVDRQAVPPALRLGPSTYRVPTPLTG